MEVERVEAEGIGAASQQLGRSEQLGLLGDSILKFGSKDVKIPKDFLEKSEYILPDSPGKVIKIVKKFFNLSNEDKNFEFHDLPQTEYDPDEHELYEFYKDLPEIKQELYLELIQKKDVYSIINIIEIACVMKSKVLEQDIVMVLHEILKGLTLRESAELFNMDLDMTSEEIELSESIISEISDSVNSGEDKYRLNRRVKT